MIGHKIKKHFDFLREYGFKREKYDNGIDYEYNYRKFDIEICVIYAVGFSSEIVKPYIKDNYYEFPTNCSSEKLDKQNEANLHYGVDIIITKGGKQSNILGCDFFDELSLNVLKNNIINYRGNVEQLFEIYGTFLKKNIKQLL